MARFIVMHRPYCVHLRVIAGRELMDRLLLRDACVTACVVHIIMDRLRTFSHIQNVLHTRAYIEKGAAASWSLPCHHNNHLEEEEEEE